MEVSSAVPTAMASSLLPSPLLLPSAETTELDDTRLRLCS